jgi:phosphoribosylaminoimidazole-succinocarboxamide synthase
MQNETYDIYDLGDQMLMVAHDRLVIAGQVFPGLIPSKGRAIKQLAIFWHELFEGFLDSSLISSRLSDLPETFAAFADELEGRFMLVKKVEMFPIRARVYGYLTADVVNEYFETGTVGGVDTEPGYVLNSFMKQCIYIPFLTEPGQPDQQIDLMKTIELFGNYDGMLLCSEALKFYEIIHGLAKSRGVIFAEIDLGFGLLDGKIVIADVPSPDNSKLWSAADNEPGQEHELFVFQPLNDWLAANWDFVSTPPAIPEELIEGLSKRYIEVTELVTGEDFE